jgi:hypothetical protein
MHLSGLAVLAAALAALILGALWYGLFGNAGRRAAGATSEAARSDVHHDGRQLERLA